jgi:hypothetical protein
MEVQRRLLRELLRREKIGFGCGDFEKEVRNSRQKKIMRDANKPRFKENRDEE